MSKAPSMPMFWDAYLADTTHLTTEEHGAYMLLLAAMWRRNGWVPDDDRDNARILGMTPAKWKRTKARLSGFLTFDGGHVTQKNLLKTWEITQEKIEANRANGAKGGRPKSSDNKELGKANGSASVKQKKTTPEPEPEVKREAIASPKKRACAIPENWVPSEANTAHALSKQFSQLEIEDEANQFRDYHLAKGSTFKDWDAAWRTWIANAIKFGNRGMAGKPKSSGYGQGGSIASIVARREFERQGRG